MCASGSAFGARLLYRPHHRHPRAWPRGLICRRRNNTTPIRNAAAMTSGGVSASRSASIPAPPLSHRPCLLPGIVTHRRPAQRTPVLSRAEPGAESHQPRSGQPRRVALCIAPRHTGTPAPCRHRMAGSGGVFHADLHVHSRFSRACSKDAEIGNLAWWAARKGAITVIGTGDFTHPAWAAELAELLVPAEPGLLALSPNWRPGSGAPCRRAARHEIRFLLSTEISTIYKRDGATRKVHHLLYAPTFEAASAITTALAKVGQPGFRRPANPRPGLPSPLGNYAERRAGVLPHSCPHLDAVVRRSWVEVRVRRRTRLLPRPSRTCLRRGDGTLLGPADELDLLRA